MHGSKRRGAGAPATAPAAVAARSAHRFGDASAQVRARTLDNGLSVIVWPDPNIPNVALCNWVHVGSRNEGAGTTGLAHFFEHMMFNGTSRLAQGQFDALLEARGGSNNAYTLQDVTVYQDWFPRAALELVLDLESDRLANLAFDPAVVENERQVVSSERRLRVDDSNAALLDEQMQATAFVAHPYRIPTIGWPSDIQSWTLADLQQFFRVYYAPNNCTLVLAGDVEPDEVFDLVQRYFGPIARGVDPPPVRTQEPVQHGERRLLLRRPGHNPLLQYDYHAIRASDPRQPALNLLQTILVGGDASQLHRALVEEGKLAVAINGGWSEGFDPNVFVLQATLPVGGSVAGLEQALDAQLEQLVQRGVTSAQLRRAQNIAAADFWRSVATIDGKARLLGEYAVMHGDHRRLFDAPAAYERVTCQDVLDIARVVFNADRRTVGVLQPTGTAVSQAGLDEPDPDLFEATDRAAALSESDVGEQGDEEADEPAGGEAEAASVAEVSVAEGSLAAAGLPPYIGPDAGADVKLPPYQRFTLENGVRVILVPRHDVPLLAFDAVIRGGARLDPAGCAGTASLTAELLTHGAGARDAYAFADAVEGAGGSLDADARSEAVLVHGQFLARDQALLLELLADALQRPRLAAAQFDPLRLRRVELLKALKDSDPQALLGDYGRALLFGEHPLAAPVGGSEASLTALQLQDVQRFYREQFGADRLTLVFAGDFDPDEFRGAIARAFSSWARAPAPLPPFTAVPRRRGRRVLLVDAPESAQTYFWIGNVGVARGDPGRAALNIANTAFGGSFGSLLMQALRSRSGLTYSVNSSFWRGSVPGEFAISSFTQTASTARALDLALDTLGSLRRGLDDAAIESARSYALGQYPLAFETAADWAAALADLDLYGLEDDYVDGYGAALRKVDAAGIARAIDGSFPDPADVDIVLIGDAARIRGAARALGPVLEKPLAAEDFVPPAGRVAAY